MSEVSCLVRCLYGVLTGRGGVPLYTYVPIYSHIHCTSGHPSDEGNEGMCPD